MGDGLCVYKNGVWLALELAQERACRALSQYKIVMYRGQSWGKKASVGAADLEQLSSRSLWRNLSQCYSEFTECQACLQSVAPTKQFQNSLTEGSAPWRNQMRKNVSSSDAGRATAASARVSHTAPSPSSASVECGRSEKIKSKYVECWTSDDSDS